MCVINILIDRLKCFHNYFRLNQITIYNFEVTFRLHLIFFKRYQKATKVNHIITKCLFELFFKPYKCKNLLIPLQCIVSMASCLLRSLWSPRNLAQKLQKFTLQRVIWKCPPGRSQNFILRSVVKKFDRFSFKISESISSITPVKKVGFFIFFA